ncbi:hypothetical protein ABZV60_23100 [Streptomyces sp. NPDC004787]|uniref:hypothetical protein n=1 Tax=Streptomyces sp. NPDC004787 TaxID=3154291 RepID=UPI0033B6B998
MGIVVTGRLKQRVFDDDEGQRLAVVEFDAEEIAVSQTYETATVTAAYRPGKPVAGQARSRIRAT